MLNESRASTRLSSFIRTLRLRTWHLVAAGLVSAVVTGVPLWAEHQEKKALVIERVNQLAGSAVELEYHLQRIKDRANAELLPDGLHLRVLLSSVERQVRSIDEMRPALSNAEKHQILDNYEAVLMLVRDLLQDSLKGTAAGDTSSLATAGQDLRKAKEQLLAGII